MLGGVLGGALGAAIGQAWVGHYAVSLTLVAVAAFALWLAVVWLI